MNIATRILDELPAYPRARIIHHRTCPFCGSEPGLAVKRANYWLVGCESDDCRINPQAGSSESAEAAWADWNRRAR